MRQVLEPGALGRPRGIGWRGRWEGGSGWGIHVYPWLIHVNVWWKPLQYCKVISLQLIKKKCKKKKTLQKQRAIFLLTKVHLVKTMIFPVIMPGCESWTIKKAECQRINAFELWCWRRLLRVPWATRRSNQPILKEISPEYSLEGLMLKLKLQYFGHLMWRTDSLERPWCWERLKVEEGDNRGWDGWMSSPTQ